MTHTTMPAGFVPTEPTIVIDGQDQPELAAGLLVALVEETVDVLYRCELTFGNWGVTAGASDFVHFSRKTLDFGKKIEVGMGAGPGAGTVFRGRISALEATFPGTGGDTPSFTILAEDRLQDLRMTRRSRTFEKLTDEDLFREVAKQHQLKAELDVDKSVSHRVLAQVNQTDLAFLRDRARAIDAELWVDDATLHVQARARRSAGTIKLDYASSLREFTVVADLAGQRSEVRVTGWDVAAKEAIAGVAGPSAVSAELGNLTGGAAILDRAFGPRKEQIAHATPATYAEARQLADTTYRRAARRFVVGIGVAAGDARLRVGAHLSLSGIGPLFSGDRYYVTEARHVFSRDEGDDAGYRTHFRVERPGIGA